MVSTRGPTTVVASSRLPRKARVPAVKPVPFMVMVIPGSPWAGMMESTLSAGSLGSGSLLAGAGSFWFLRRHDEVGAKSAMTTHLLGLYNDLATDDSTPRATLNTYVGVSDNPIWTKPR